MSDQNPKSSSHARLNSFRSTIRELSKQMAGEPDRAFLIEALTALAELQEQQTLYLEACVHLTTRSIDNLRGDATSIHKAIEELEG